MHHILFEYRGEKHFITKTDNRIVNGFIIATRACNVYVKETMLTRDTFINDINHLAKA
jgi:hypothetical protein